MSDSLLVVRLSAFGDVIHTIPAVVALREHYDIAWAVERPYAELVEIVANVRAVPVSLKRWSWRNVASARTGVRGFDKAVDFQGLVKSSLLARASGARERYGFAREFIRETPAAWFVNRPVRIDPSRHVVEWNLQVAAALAPVSSAPDVDFSAFAEGAADAAGRVVLLPGAGRAEKQWPHFAELARRIGRDAVVAWGPGEEALARNVGAELAPPTNFRELAQLLRTARLVIGGDTGPLHLAAALGTPVIGLYGPTDPRRNGPYGQLENVVRSPDGAMASIRVDDVLLKIKSR